MISHATILGRTHRLMRQNCQDFAACISLGKHVAIGIVGDGCGSKHKENNQSTISRNETGANLLGQFALAFLAAQLGSLPQPPGPAALEERLADLHQACLSFLHQLLAHYPEPARRTFMITHLLTTLVGFVRTPDTAVFFWQGDGYLAANGRIHPIDANNQPDYLAYQLLEAQPTPLNFRLAYVPRPQELAWLAVATDGWNTELLARLGKPRSQLMLQRWLNVQCQQRGHFDDDGAVAVWYADAPES